MKNIFRKIIFVLLISARGNGNVVKIGALLHDPQARIPLESTIYTNNVMQHGLQYKIETNIVPDMDSFKSSKILCNIAEQEDGIAGIFGPSSPVVSPLIHSICSLKEIPNIQVNWRPFANFLETDTAVNFHPDPEILSKGVAVIVRHLEWRSFVVLYENDDGLIRLQDVLKMQQFSENKFNSIIVRHLGSGPDYRPLLKEVRNSTETKIILDCETENVIKILKQAQQVKLLENYYDYFLTSLDAHTIDLKVLDTNANITTIRIIDPENDDFVHALKNWQQYAEYHGTGVDLEPYSIKTETALLHDAAAMFVETVNALRFKMPIKPTSVSCDDENSKWTTGFAISSFMKIKNNPLGITGPINFDPLGRRINFTLHVVEGNRDNRIATWNPQLPESLSFLRSGNDTFNALISHMQKGVLIISSRLGPPYLMKRIARDGEPLVGNDRYEGYSMDLIGEIANILGFKFEFKLTEDGKYGSYDPKTKSWNGLIQDILEHQADLAICDLTITHQRGAVVDFSLPFMTLGISILYKNAAEKEVNIFAFLDPFHFDVWIYTATLYLTVSVILYFVSRMAPGDWENPHPCDENPTELENIWDIKNCCWLTLGSIMTQGCDILPKGFSSRMASSMWWFFSLIMTSSYTANLAAFLTMERMEPAIDGAEALAKQSKIKYGTVDGGATQAFFRDSNYSTYQRMYATMQQSKPSVFEKNNADGVKRVQTTRQGLYAFLMESSQIEYEVETKCDLKQVGSWLDSKGYGIAMPVGYPFRTAINTAILKLQEDGKLGELKDKWWTKRRDEPSCESSGASEESSAELALTNVGGVFLVLGIGVAIAFVLALLEFLWNVRNISVEEHLSYWEALNIEVIFALNIWVTKKRTKPETTESSSLQHSGSIAPLRLTNTTTISDNGDE